MPNWCLNRLVIRGEKEDLLEFKKLLDDDKVKFEDANVCLFRTFAPMPDELRDSTSPNRDEEQAKLLIEKYGAKDWYDWQINTWGIKWGCCNAEWEVSEPIPTDYGTLHDLALTYDTPWGPGDDCLKDIFRAHDKLSFFLSYEEPGMGFQGNLFVKNGNPECQEYSEYITRDIEGVWY